MDRRQRMMLQAGLALLTVLLAWRLGTEAQQANLRYSALESIAEPSAAGPRTAAPQETLAVNEIAARNLFSADRNNELPEPEVGPPAPPPSEPIVLGILKLGADYEALMSEDESSRRGVQRAKVGDLVGGYRVVEIRSEGVVIEYEGRRTTLDIHQSAPSARRTAAPARTASPSRTTRPAGPVVVGTGGPAARTPAAGRTSGTGQQSAAPRGREIRVPNQDPYTRVFIEGNQRRIERQTPFGLQTSYAPLQPGDTEQE